NEVVSLWKLHACDTNTSQTTTKVVRLFMGGVTVAQPLFKILLASLVLSLGVSVDAPAQAADLGGDCCADFEERLGQLEATTVQKGFLGRSWQNYLLGRLYSGFRRARRFYPE